MSKIKTPNFSDQVLAWFDVNGRKHLPWQQPEHPQYAYYTWVSEIMLQQTQVTTVIPYFNRFIAQFPTIKHLAAADSDSVLKHWAGLGYYARARNLHAAAKLMVSEHNGCVPDEMDKLTRLPGIGLSTAGAILSLAYGQSHPILDGNVKRVLARVNCVSGDPSKATTVKKLWQIAAENTPATRCGDYTQAMMDLGALVCTRTNPKCHACPVQVSCQAHQTGCVADYPNKKQKRVRPVKKAIFWIIHDEKRLVLTKRAQTGIWGGLWSLPETPVEAEDLNSSNLSDITALVESYLPPLLIEQDVLNITSGKSSSGSLPPEIDYQIQPKLTHDFTHYRLEIIPVSVVIKELQHGVLMSSWNKKALPAPVQTLLNDFFDR